MTLAAKLFELERLDSDLEQREAALRDVRRRQARNPELEAAEKRLDALRLAEGSASTEQRSLESDLAELEAKIRRDQSRMYGGQIVDPRELASLERELENYRTHHGELEERCLSAMERVEQLQGEIVVNGRTANELRERWEGDRRTLSREEEAMTDVLAGMRSERDELAGSIDPRALAQYQRLRDSLGHAVSAVQDGVCEWCRVKIPAKDVQHARNEALVICTNCSRILYVA